MPEIAAEMAHLLFVVMRWRQLDQGRLKALLVCCLEVSLWRRRENASDRSYPQQFDTVRRLDSL